MKNKVLLQSIKDQILTSVPPQNMKTKIVAIDGLGGAGKSTLANDLSRYLSNCAIVHTDDFATPENPLNWYQRMIDEVLRPLSVNELAKYRKYSWDLNQITDWVDVKPGGILLLEGVSSSRKEFRSFLSFSIYVDTRREERLKRGLKRDGVSALEQWKAWMQEEDQYFQRDRPDLYADLVVSGEAT